MDGQELADDPLALLERWLAEAREAAPLADAMTLATADPSGRPSARIVLLRGLDERGLTFFTNRASHKGDDLRRNPRAAVVFHWWELGRQARVEGFVEETSVDESSTYWASRPRASQLAAWASHQSKPLAGREELDAQFAEAARRFSSQDVPLPSFWGGYRIVPEQVEFWAHRESRLHDRICYLRTDEGWARERLAP